MKLSTALTILTNIAVAITDAADVKDCSKSDAYDAIVVGAGLSGSIVAAKLATKNPDKCILVIEGGMHSGQVVSAEDANVAQSVNGFYEAGLTSVYESPETLFNVPGTYDNLVCWDYKCDYIWGEDESNTPPGLVVGRIVGGSGSLNGALMQYPSESLWDPYPAGWKASDMKDYLDEIHNTMNATSIPSMDGVHYNDERGANDVRKAMKAIGYIEAEDAAYWKPFGGTMGIPRVTTKNGRRASSTSEYLKPALEQTNIELMVETEAKQILIEHGTKASGLMVKQNNELKNIMLTEGGLIVLSAGGVKTPQLLLESKVGPSPDSKVVNDAVGKSLTDKTIAWVEFYAPDVKAYDLYNPPPKDQENFIKYGTGPLTQFGPLLVGLIKVPSEVTGSAPERRNMIEFFVSAAKADGYITVYFVHLTPDKGEGATIYPDPDNEGKFLVKGDQFNIEFSTNSTNYAIDVVSKAMEAQGHGRVPIDSKGRGGEPWLHNMNHPGGTCALDKCIEPDTLLVKGLDNVGVCDNAIIPEQATVHTALTLMGIASRGGDIFSSFLAGEKTSVNDEL
jgi:choline dehydrogenase